MQHAGKVGLLVIVFAVMLVGTYAFLQRSFFAPKTTQYFAEFKDAGGVATGAKVLLAGVDIGQVTRVELIAGTRARMTLAVREEVQIPQGAEAVLPTSFIGIGDRQIELVPPVKPQSGQLAPGSTIQGSIRSPLDAILPDSGTTIAALETTLGKANQTLDAATKLMSDRELKGNLNKLLAESSATAQKFGALAARLDQAMRANEATIAAIVRNGQSVSGDLASVSRELRVYVQQGTLQKNVDTLFTKLNQAMDNGNAILSEVRTLAADPSMQKNLKDIVANTQVMTAKGTEIAENAKVLTAKGTEFADEATLLMKKANKLADNAAELMDELKKKLIGGTGTGIISPLKNIRASADVLRETDPNRWRTELTATVPLSSKSSLELGLWDAFESNKLTARMGQKLGKDAEFRYGVYASKPSVGVELPIASKLRLRGDVFGINKTRFDLRARFDINKNVHGWIGLERIFERNAPSIGVGIRP